MFGRTQSFLDVFLDVVESNASLLGVLNIDVVRRVRAKPGVADTPMREERSLVDMWSLGGRRHSSSSKIGRPVGLVVASKRRELASVEKGLIEALGQVRKCERWVMDTSGRKKGSMLVGRLVEASGLLKMSSAVRAARLHLRRGRSSRLNGWELLLLWVVHVVVPEM